MPFASRTVLCMTPPMDISVIEIPRIVVCSTRLCSSIADDECTTIPSWPPTTVQRETIVSPVSML